MNQTLKLKPIQHIFILFLSLTNLVLHAQEVNHIKAELNTETHTLNIQQELVYTNKSLDTLNEIWLYDWNNAYVDKTTPLAKRFAEEFNKSIHLARPEQRGHTEIISLTDPNYGFLKWERLKVQDIIRVQLNFPIYPGKSYRLKLSYKVKLPSAEFTGYGYNNFNDYRLRYWYIVPGIYDEKWMAYSNKNLNDLNQLVKEVSLELTVPKTYTLISDLDQLKAQENGDKKTLYLKGQNRGEIQLDITKSNNFETVRTNDIELITNLQSRDTLEVNKSLSAERVFDFLENRLGSYPHNKIMVSEEEYGRSPNYGINQLPSFLRPFPDSFQYDLKLLKIATQAYLDNTLFLDDRKEHWVKEGIQIYLMMAYINTYYKDMKLLGKLSKIWGIRNYHLAQMDFNDQYPLLYMLTARNNTDQPLNISRDSLIKFNERIANRYKSGVGLAYLNSYLGDHYIDRKIKEYYNAYAQKSSSAQNFEDFLKADTPKDIDWYFDTFIETKDKIDFKITKLHKTKDSVFVNIKNKRGTEAPITLFGMDKNDSILFKQWYQGIDDTKKVSVPKKDLKRLVLNYDRIIPEINERDNWKSVNGFLSTDRKLKFQFFKDFEDPYYNQILYVPVFSFNIYDGVTTGLRFYNKTFLAKPFLYDLKPSYAFGEGALVGSGTFRYRDYVEHGNMHQIDYYLYGSSFHYADGLRYSTITPSITFHFRNDDLRSNERELLNVRFVNVLRDKSPTIDSDPDYSVLNARYAYGNNGIIDYRSWFVDLEVASEFSKLSFNWEMRKLFPNNRQLNLRVFAGKFIYNQTNSDFFSFALDRPTDYMFDYDYLGRSEDSGIFSQQLIISEGGFKSKLYTPYANDWIVTTNASINIWKWIEVYGDLGMIKNKYQDAHFVYDSGIRLNLVTDYFELYLPVYSNNGWEIAQPQYDEKIRFIVTLSPKTLIGLFTRKWF